MDIIKRGVEVAFRAHLPLGGTVENLPAAGLLFAIPLMGRAAVKTAKFSEQRKNIRSCEKNMIMIGKKTPGGYLLSVQTACGQQ